MTKSPWLALVIAFMAAMLAPQPVIHARTSVFTLHVDARNHDASDAGSGNSSAPFQTINGALRAAARLHETKNSITILVHPGTYRETIIIRQPVILIGQSGTEIRGSDPWSAGWTRTGSQWTHSGTPTFFGHGLCQGDTNLCLEPVHVFYAGKPLRHVAGVPATGQFAITPDRILVLADNPQGHLVEVTTRPQWVVIASQGVTIKGFRMRQAANDTQTGAIDADGYSDIMVTDNILSDTHGAVLSFRNGNHVNILRNDISRGGQLGIHMAVVTDSLIQSNRIHENNKDAFSWGWEAGGLKASNSSRLTIDGNDVASNVGPGLWCDGDCREVTVSHNRVHDNAGPGIQYEISHRGQISNNAVWKNGLFFSLTSNSWGWGAGILIQNSDNCNVFGNTLAWNRNGISVLEQDRGVTHMVSNTSVHDNLIVSQDPVPGAILYSLSWLSDHGTNMFSGSRHNGGSSNKYGYSGVPESGAWRFAWDQGYNRLADFNATPGEHGGVYLSRAEQNAALAATAIALAP